MLKAADLVTQLRQRLIVGQSTRLLPVAQSISYQDKSKLYRNTTCISWKRCPRTTDNQHLDVSQRSRQSAWLRRTYRDRGTKSGRPLAIVSRYDTWDNCLNPALVKKNAS